MKVDREATPRARMRWYKVVKFIGIWLLGSALLGAATMKGMWGYFLVRPFVHQAVATMGPLEGITYFGFPDETPDGTKASLLSQLKAIPSENFAGSDYYDLEVQPLVAVRWAGFNPETAPDLPKQESEAAVTRFLENIRENHRHVFHGRGLVMGFRTHDGERLTYLAASVGPHSDEIATYHVLFDKNMRVLHAESYLVGWAGIEASKGFLRTVPQRYSG